jgi:hypothetical protein
MIKHWILVIAILCLFFTFTWREPFVIENVVENVKKRFYGGSCLDPTGPGMLSKFFSLQDKRELDMKHEFYFNDMNNRVINYNNIPVFKSYQGYLNDYDSTKKTEHYAGLWGQRRIYH